MTNLKTLLSQDLEYRNLTAERARKAKSARRVKIAFRWCRSGFLLSTLCASLIGGGLLFVSGANSAGGTALSDETLSLVLIIQAVLLGVAGLYAFNLSARDYYGTATEARLKAEELRWELQYFALKLSDALSILPQFEARFLTFLDNQIRHLEGCTTRHRASLRWIIWFGAAATGVTALVQGLSAIASFSTVLVVAVLSACLPGLTVFLDGWTDQREGKLRAKLHDDSCAGLKRLRAKSGRLSTAIQAKDLETAKAYVDDVIALLR
ncbi:hypothetical protein TRP8649_03659 [Pelagimonas phthalicica]|uniref:Uncharacterized protein n=1 Tax=Pelagimonas phthalicica TaxID=1037362 RepID=A0A238JGJ8_9RHOB|nr:hypothetical protein [Pelagimonas phthalicica]TDS92452.1 hypothetical protein CLV87_3654 [Pelagimonas phthalicica]SMX29523.1 hypothetical protein TRP8649_03659 [Pelagimonas phthalicica]